MLFAQPGMPFLSLIPWPTPIHPKESQHWCPFLSADFPASNKSSSAHCSTSLTPQAGDSCVQLWRLWNSQA